MSSEDTAPTGAETALTFDQHVQQLPVSRQAAHRWLIWLVVASLVVVVGLLAYAIYTSVTWAAGGGIRVLMAWMFFLLAGAAVAILMGIDALVIGATMPPPFQSAQRRFIAGPNAVRQAWGMIATGLIGGAFALVIITTLRSAGAG